MAAAGSDPGRLASLDQFRGYTVLGMFFVNFVGSFEVIPAIFKHHHTYCSYADTIMPQFFFAVGFAYRLTLLRRLKSAGPTAAYLHIVRRNLGLILLGVVVYHLGGHAATWEELRQLTAAQFATQAIKRNVFQTLVHIGVTSLWVLPVIAAGVPVRVLFAAASGLLHLGLSAWFNYAWVHQDPVGIDGGPLGFLTWTIPLLAGSLAYDVVSEARGPASRTFRLAVGGAVLMATGYALNCLTTPPGGGLGFRLAAPPFVMPPDGTRDLWTMSQRAGSLSYLTFAAGFAVVLYALFYLVCDVLGWRLALFTTLGGNALAGYIIHDMVDSAVSPYAPGNAPWWYVLTVLAVYLFICWLFLRKLEKDRLFLRL
jgi:predicted acyltransferase